MIGAKINLDGESLPDGWSVQLVGDIGEYINGYPFKPTEWKERGLPIVRIQNLNDATKSFNYFPDRLDEKYLVRNGDILISWSASLGTFLWRRGDAWLNQHIFKAHPDEAKIDRSFFYWAMVYGIDRIAKNARGSTMVHVTAKEFKGSEILLPTRIEQRKIAGVLGVVQRAIEQQGRLLALTAELKKALLHQLFTAGLRGEPQKQTAIGPVPENWEVVELGDVISQSPKNGLYKHNSAYGSGTPILRINDFSNDGDIVMKASHRLATDANENELYALREGDIVTNRVNSLSHLGKTALIGKLDEPMVFESNMMRYRIEERRAVPCYILRLLNSPVCKKQFLGTAKRAVGQIP